jgi:hypothetical protein
MEFYIIITLIVAIAILYKIKTNNDSNEIGIRINRNEIEDLRKDFDLLVQHLDLHYEDPPRRIIKKS